MIGTPERDFNVILAILVATLALLGWTVLWRRWSAAVHWWWTASLVGAAHLALQAQSSGAHGIPLLLLYPVLATCGVGSLVFKALALWGLTGRSGKGRVVLVLLLLNFLVALGLAIVRVERATFSAYVTGSMLLGLTAAVMSAHRLARAEQLRSARLLMLALAIPGPLVLALFVVMIGGGKDVLASGTAPLPLGVIIPTLVIAVFNAGLFIGVVLELAERRQAVTARALARERLDRLRLEERARLVADLHDGFGSQLTSARLQAGRHQLSTDALCVLLDECLADLHLVVDTVDNLEGDIGDSLRYLRHRLAGRLEDGPVVLHWAVETDGAPALRPERLLQVLRILQEAIGNALRHAEAQVIRVAAEYDERRGQLRCTVVDDGRGFDLRQAEGAGLRNMYGRAWRLAAELAVCPTPQGTTVTLTVPVGTSAAPRASWPGAGRARG
jgi:signal transduction histidine kinase